MKKLIEKSAGVAAWLVAAAAKCAAHFGEKNGDGFRDGRGKFLRAYRGKLRFTPEYERLLVFSLISVMRADGKISLFETEAMHAVIKLYREIVGRSVSGGKLIGQIKAVIGEISGKESGELIAAAMPMSKDEKYFLTECAFHVAQWDGMHRREKIFIQHLADEMGINLPPDIYEKAHRAGMEMTAKLRRSHPELWDD